MDAKLYANLVSRIPLFQPLKPEELDEIVKFSKLMRVQPKVTVLKEGAPGNAMFILVEGKCAVLKAIGKGRGQTEVATISAPSVFGEMALIDGAPRSATIVTETQSVLMQVNLNSFNALRKAGKPAAFKILRQLSGTLAQRLDEKVERLMEFYRNPEKNMARIEQLFLSRQMSQD